MITPNSNHDAHAILREILRSDAASVQKPPFNMALHYATMRRIRALSAAKETVRGGKLMLAFACVLVFGIVTVLWTSSGLSPRKNADNYDRVAAASVSTQRALAWAYERTVAQSDEAFLNMLDHDAIVLLPQTPSVFLCSLN